MFAVGSFPLDQAEPDRGCSPSHALEEIPPEGAFIILLESNAEPDKAHPPEDSTFRPPPPRPQHFELNEKDLHNYECFGLSYRYEFSDQGRNFLAFISFGERATTQTKDEALSILDSLDVSRRS
jgi:hypothetical protein